jgi:hypothetical protein
MSRGKMALAPVLLALALAAPSEAQTTTAFRTGEQVTGMSKQCYYTALGSEYTRTVRSTELCPLSIQVYAGARAPTAPPAPPASHAGYITAYRTGERTTGMTKQCFYDGLGNVYTRTVSSVELCPLSIRVQL